MNKRLLTGISSIALMTAGCGGTSMSYYEGHGRYHHDRAFAVSTGEPPPPQTVVVEQHPVVVEQPVVVERRPVYVERPAVIVDERPRHYQGAEVRVFDGRRNIWISIERGHVHGPHCGHVFVHGRWEVR